MPERAREQRDALPASVRTLLEQGLLAEPILVLGDAATARALARIGLQARAVPARPELARLGQSATVLDLGWLAHQPEVRRRAALKELASAVAPGGTLHVLAPRAATSLRGLGRTQWSLLAGQDLVGPAGQLAWLLTFVHTAPARRPRKPVRHFSDLGTFGSLDFGASTERSYGG